MVAGSTQGKKASADAWQGALGRMHIMAAVGAITLARPQSTNDAAAKRGSAKVACTGQVALSAHVSGSFVANELHV